MLSTNENHFVQALHFMEGDILGNTYVGKMVNVPQSQSSQFFPRYVETKEKLKLGKTKNQSKIQNDGKRQTVKYQSMKTKIQIE